MGFKTVDITPLGSLSPTIPGSKPTSNQFSVVARTDTVAKTLSVMPAQATLLGLTVLGSVASDAGTTAVLTFTLSNNTGSISTGTYNVKTNGAVTGSVTMSNMPNLEALPQAGDLRLTCAYSETGTAANTGGPWYVRIYFAT